MFKKQKLADANKQLEEFKKPKIKHSREIKTHLRERTVVEKILYLFSSQNKRKTAFRMILSMDEAELNKNIYIIGNRVLNTLIQDKNIEKSFYSVITKMLKCNNAPSIKDLCVKYLKAQLNFDPNYLTFLEYLMRHFSKILIKEKLNIATCIEDNDIKKRLLKLNDNTKTIPYSCNSPFYFLR